MLPLRRLQVSFAQTVAGYSRLLTTSPVVRGLEEFLDAPVKEGEQRVVGRSWKAMELRNKSFDDLHKLWYVLLKERNMLQSEQMLAKAEGRQMVQPMRISSVRKSMARIKLVLSERAHAQPNLRDKKAMKRIVDG